MPVHVNDLLGAHVSTQGGVHTAPGRAEVISATAIQVFTKTPNQWRDPVIAADEGKRFRRELRKTGVRSVVAHDSYLINLASPDPGLRARSIKSFIAELLRCQLLGIRAVVSHPGNYLDDRGSGLSRNAESYIECLEAVPGPIKVLLETTAGTGTALGSSFEELAEIRERTAGDWTLFLTGDRFADYQLRDTRAGSPFLSAQTIFPARPGKDYVLPSDFDSIAEAITGRVELAKRQQQLIEQFGTSLIELRNLRLQLIPPVDGRFGRCFPLPRPMAFFLLENVVDQPAPFIANRISVPTARFTDHAQVGAMFAGNFPRTF